MFTRIRDPVPYFSSLCYFFPFLVTETLRALLERTEFKREFPIQQQNNQGKEKSIQKNYRLPRENKRKNQPFFTKKRGC